MTLTLLSPPIMGSYASKHQATVLAALNEPFSPPSRAVTAIQVHNIQRHMARETLRRQKKAMMKRREAEMAEAKRLESTLQLLKEAKRKQYEAVANAMRPKKNAQTNVTKKVDFAFLNISDEEEDPDDHLLKDKASTLNWDIMDKKTNDDKTKDVNSEMLTKTFDEKLESLIDAAEAAKRPHTAAPSYGKRFNTIYKGKRMVAVKASAVEIFKEPKKNKNNESTQNCLNGNDTGSDSSVDRHFERIQSNRIQSAPVQRTASTKHGEIQIHKPTSLWNLNDSINIQESLKDHHEALDKTRPQRKVEVSREELVKIDDSSDDEDSDDDWKMPPKKSHPNLYRLALTEPKHKLTELEKELEKFINNEYKPKLTISLKARPQTSTTIKPTVYHEKAQEHRADRTALHSAPAQIRRQSIVEPPIIPKHFLSASSTRTASLKTDQILLHAHELLNRTTQLPQPPVSQLSSTKTVRPGTAKVSSSSCNARQKKRIQSAPSKIPIARTALSESNRSTKRGTYFAGEGIREFARAEKLCNEFPNQPPNEIARMIAIRNSHPSTYRGKLGDLSHLRAEEDSILASIQKLNLLLESRLK